MTRRVLVAYRETPEISDYQWDRAAELDGAQVGTARICDQPEQAVGWLRDQLGMTRPVWPHHEEWSITLGGRELTTILPQPTHRLIDGEEVSHDEWAGALLQAIGCDPGALAAALDEGGQRAEVARAIWAVTRHELAAPELTSVLRRLAQAFGFMEGPE